MDALGLVLIFVLIVIGVWLKKPLHLSLLLASVAAFLIYDVPFSHLGGVLHRGILGEDTLQVVLSFYFITFLQRMLEKRSRLIQAEEAITALFGSRRINAMLTPFVVGMMPSVGAVLIAAPIVDRAAGEALDRDERMFVSSFYRHISEAFLPTYATILLALKLADIQPLSFLLGMMPVVFMQFLLGYLFYVRKIPRTHEGEAGHPLSRRQALLALLRSLWGILLTVILILALPLPIYLVVLAVILLNVLVDRFSWQEIKPLFRSAFEGKLIISTLAIMVFKEVLGASGVLLRLPAQFASLPIPSVTIYALMMFLGSLIAGFRAMVAIVIPLAFTGTAGLPLLVLLMSAGYMAAQISPTHICLTVVAEHYQSSLMALVRKTLPVLGVFAVFIVGYYYLLKWL